MSTTLTHSLVIGCHERAPQSLKSESWWVEMRENTHLLGIEIVCWPNDNSIGFSNPCLLQAHGVVGVSWQVEEINAIYGSSWHALQKHHSVSHFLLGT